MKRSDISPHAVYAISSKPGFDRWADQLYVVDAETSVRNQYPYGFEVAPPGTKPATYLGIRANGDYFTEHAAALAKLDVESLLGNDVDARLPEGGTVVLYRPQQVKDAWAAHTALVQAAIGLARAKGLDARKANARRRATIAEIKAAIAQRDIDPTGVRATYRTTGEITMPAATLQALLGLDGNEGGSS